MPSNLVIVIKKMRDIILIFTMVLVIASCGGANYFKDYASVTSDEALFEDALKLIDKASYAAAIAKINETSSAFRAQHRVVRALAGAHAGRCGLNFMSFIEGIGGGGTPFGLFKNGFTNTVVVPEECQTAQNLIESAFGATAAQRVVTLGESQGNEINMFMAILGMSKIGSNLRNISDSDQDGSNDAGYDSCDANILDDTATKQVGTGFGLLLDNFTVIAASFDPATATLIEGLATVCDSIDPNPCIITDPDAPTWDASMLLVMRSLTKSSSVGIESCGSGDPPSNPAPYPFSCCAP